MPSGFDGLPLTRDYAIGSIRGVRAIVHPDSVVTVALILPVSG